MSELSDPANRKKSLRVRLAVLGALVVLAAATGSYAALQIFAAEDIPDVGQLADHEPSIITTVHAANGDVLAEFAEEQRKVVEYRRLPKVLINAIVAVEDAGFYEHSGLNIRGILRAAIANAKAGRVVEGGSSVTQQLAKLMFLSPERKLRRKIKEALLALNIERTYSKEEILAFYCNQIYLGHNRYGVEAASLFYFGKHVWEIELVEAALLGGLPKAPEGFSPIRHPEASRKRRNHVLDRMAAVGYITLEEAEEAKSKPLELKRKQTRPRARAPYFVEEVRQQLEAEYGAKALYHHGLTVHTTLDIRLQTAAEVAVRDGLLALDRRQGWRGPTKNVLRDDPEQVLADWRHEDWIRRLEVDDVLPGLVIEVSGRRARIRIGDREGQITKAPRWTRQKRVSDLYAVGDVGLFRITGLAGDDGPLTLSVEQEPLAEAALIALDVKTGEIRAMVGGWDFRRSRFNRAVQGKRQTGSAFKPLLYATAIDAGYTASDTLFDEPIAITDPTTGAVYSPENHGLKYHGLTTIREGLEKSRNPFAVQLLQKVGAEQVISVARRLGITSRLEPYPSLALGAFEVPLIELTGAYGAFADMGMVHRPYSIKWIEDRQQRIVQRNHPSSRQAISPEVAFVTNYLMRGVIQNGTGRRAKSLGRPLAGKTGTTDDFTDAWFIGNSPSIVCGVWVGFDQKKTLGRDEEGARTALPIWIDFMAALLEGTEKEEYRAPPGIEFVEIDKKTGLRASGSCSSSFQEAFLRGTAPVKYCSRRDHELRALPYYFQKLYFEDRGGGSVSRLEPEPVGETNDLLGSPGAEAEPGRLF